MQTEKKMRVRALLGMLSVAYNYYQTIKEQNTNTKADAALIKTEILTITRSNHMFAVCETLTNFLVDLYNPKKREPAFCPCEFFKANIVRR